MNRKLAYLKVVLKKEELRAMEKRLETAVRILQSAQNGYMITLLKLQPDKIVAKAFQQSRLSRQEMTNASLQHEATTPDVSESRSDHVTLATTRSYPFNPFGDRWSSQVWSASIRVPRWFYGAQRAWEFCAARSYSGWKFNLRVYNLRSKFSSVFTAAQNRYVENLQRQFDNGKASPFDQDTLGRTLAHYGTMGTSVDTLKLLVDMGISISDPDHNGWYDGPPLLDCLKLLLVLRSPA
ncbi:ankyrin repeat-containing protein [Apiospora arundinis]|uniref:Ankyrin repeat-containing protein n=1 Tax=Apiospora arundinis TaxID=335852 RepID=A0ABR2IHJ0_9PEZI